MSKKGRRSVAGAAAGVSVRAGGRARAGRGGPVRAEGLEPRVLLAYASLVRDVNTTTDMLAPERLTVVGSQVFFAGRGVDGSDTELWKTDGTREGTVQVKEIVPGLLGSDPQNFTDVGGVVFFTARDLETGYELWKSDGTAAGTVRVKDIRPGTADSMPKNLVDVNGTLYFNADDGAGGAELWRSDGTAAGTVRVKDVRAGSSGSDPQYLTAHNGMVLFSADDGSSGRELWRSDGTAAGTVRVADLQSGSFGSQPRSLVAFDGSVFFAADPGGFGSSSRGDLYRTDGTTVVRVKEINFGGTGSSDYSTLYTLTPSGDRLYFVAGNLLTGAYELWRSDGTGAGTFKLLGGSSITRYTPLTPAGANALVFPFTSAAYGAEMWQTDGTAAGTRLLADLVPGPGKGVQDVVAARVGGDVYFAPNRWDGQAELYKTDLSSTSLVANVEGAAPALSWPVAFESQLLFIALRYIDQGDLFVSDGTAAGTRRVGAVSPGNGSSMMDYPTTNYSSPAFFAVGQTVYFAARDGATGSELWRTEPGGPLGSDAAASLVADLQPGGDGSDPAGFASAADGSFYFSASTYALGRELYRIAPGGGAPQLVADLAGGPGSSDPRAISSAGDWIYFTAASSPASSEYYVWRYNPSYGAPERLVSPSGQFLTRGTTLTRVGNYWYFVAATSATGSEVWRVDGTSAGPELVKDVSPGSGHSYPGALTALGGMLIFAATDSGGGRELWRTDSATGETERVRDITAGNGSTQIDEAYALGGVVYFGAQPDTAGAKNTLWRSDGTSGGTSPLFDLDTPRSFTSAGGKLYFVAGDAQGRAVFAYDPAIGAEPVRLTPVNSGAFPLSPSTLYAARGAVYAVAVAGTGRGDHVELWKTDGTAGGTAKVRDVQPIVPSATSPGLGAYWVGGRYALGASATHLFFPAWRAEWGLEPHALPLADPPGAVRGVVFDDRDRDGARGPGEGGLAGRTVFADFDGDGVADPDEPVATTGADGAYEIVSLDARAYVVRTVVPAGWATTGPGGAEVVAGGAPVEGVDFAVGDVAPPAATSGGAGAARPTAEVRVAFTEDVSAALSPAALELTNVTTGRAVDASAVRVEFDRAAMTAVFTFPGLPGGVLPDGNYTARVPAGSVADASGNSIASEFAFAFHVLAADVNGDRAVDFNDMVVLAQNYNKTGRAFADGDFNYDGAVDFNDLVLLAQRYNTTLAAPAPAPTPAPLAVAASVAGGRADRTTTRAVFSTAPVARPAPVRPRPSPARTYK